jgi:hypothetical protein
MVIDSSAHKDANNNSQGTSLTHMTMYKIIIYQDTTFDETSGALSPGMLTSGR